MSTKWLEQGGSLAVVSPEGEVQMMRFHGCSIRKEGRKEGIEERQTERKEVGSKESVLGIGHQEACNLIELRCTTNQIRASTPSHSTSQHQIEGVLG